MSVVLRYAATFAAFGPAIGAFASFGVASVYRPEWPGFGPVLGYTVAAYVLFAASAAATGTCVAVAVRFVGTPWKLYAVSAAIGALSPVISPVVLLLTPAFWEPVPPVRAAQAFLLFGALGAVASLACTRVMKGVQLRRDDGFPPPRRGSSPGSGA